MLGSSVSTPYDESLLFLLVALALVLLIGAASAPAWPPFVGAIVRRSAVGLSVAAAAVVYVLTPTRDPLVGLGRIFTIWCPLGVAALLYGVWSWRVGRW
ncbi:hypothetical protein J421_5291 (plasmid) [Gemmatirosa kalamazoonensis]|uniref:Uncharacterized protein n=1 Tax=Gemmatirosa kalamazoonensis TaxID=861299 RepID=W0RQ45_9BACT|nr:hypothetical protein [Gemmatirosa kalamazoonensis]AHG92826.1 hypothetical protein J421_5291 [Gemmatirosa kalamazoonensis]